MKKLDARGLSCPEPVVMIRKAMGTGEKAYEIAPTVTKTMNNILKDNKIPKLTKFLSLLNI